MNWKRIGATFAAIVTVVNVFIRIGAVITVPRKRRPTTALAWLLAIFAAPIPGTMALNLFGSTLLPKGRREKQSQINGFILDTTSGLDLVTKEDSWPRWFGSVVDLNRKLGAMPLVGGNDAQLYDDFADTMRAMTAALKKAQRYIHVEFYLFAYDKATIEFCQALDDAHKRGVTVRVLYDDWTTMRNPAGKKTVAWLKKTGIPYRAMLPVNARTILRRRPDLRNHRKVVVIDGTVGFMGSQNLVDPDYNKNGNKRRHLRWKDLMLRLEGPVVAGVNAIFITDWYAETDELLQREADPIHDVQDPDTLDCQIVPSGPGFEGENNLRLFNALVYGAQEKLIIVSPYFVPDDSMLYAITTAAQRGVEVQLFACEIGDQFMVYHAQRSYYETLLRAGVRIFLYEKPIVLHAKHFTVDSDVAVVGSSNMDMRSFSLDFEVSVMIRGRRFVDRLRAIEDDYRSKSRELSLAEWLDRPLLARILDNVCRLTAAVQ
ncbi:cardiolipin synthase A [Frondihabitans sp. PAMC 28766]|uniref:cardiolipin synthase n=1 Tax=Frondihabitans sp. PAMC 28766 TaxID=1795630 RepID=UPI00078C0C83|nr:cardiolipin synthase [Frondihabitans sp. PAMC 28766]AMM19007.1 cardiolipin synthase A [Frondihabitans sp. PAMC 28766]